MINQTDTPPINERQIIFYPVNGHTHDGQNSSKIGYTPQSIEMAHLSPDVVTFISNTAGGNTSSGTANLVQVNDLVISTDGIAPGGYETGTAQWVQTALVRFTQILMTTSTECKLTFYHKSTFNDQDREFRVENAGQYFLWEGMWAHYNELLSSEIYWKVENTGTATSQFTITLKAATMVSNGTDPAVVSGVNVINSGVPALAGLINVQAGPGITLDVDGASNTLSISASSLQYKGLTRYSLTPVCPVGYTSSATIVNGSVLPTGANTSSQGAAQFGTGLQWIKADLGTTYNMGKVKIIIDANNGATFHQCQIDVSPDNASFTTIKAAGDAWSTGDGMTVEIPNGLSVRYIRFWSNGNTVDTYNYVQSIIGYVLADAH